MNDRRLLALVICLLLTIACKSEVVFAGEKGYLNDVIFMVDDTNRVVPTGSFNASEGINLSALSAVVMDAETGQVLFAKNANQPRPIASTTKIMTALVAIECGKLNSVSTISTHAAGVEGSSVYLKAGEKLTLEELIYGALMRSGNDACVAIAEHVAGQEQIFVNFMNYKAHRLGANNTNFCNTNGLPNDKHLSSAYDLALVTRYALHNPVFSRIVSTRTHAIPGPNGKRILNNTNKMLWSYQGADGVKTGTTNAAGKCLVASASRDGRRLIAVVLHSDDRWSEAICLLNYGFERFDNQMIAVQGAPISSISVENGLKENVLVTVDKDISVTVPSGKDDSIKKVLVFKKDITSPVIPGQPVGKIEVLVDGKKVNEADLLTMEGVAKLPYHRILWRQICGIHQ